MHIDIKFNLKFKYRFLSDSLEELSHVWELISRVYLHRIEKLLGQHIRLLNVSYVEINSFTCHVAKPPIVTYMLSMSQWVSTQTQD